MDETTVGDSSAYTAALADMTPFGVSLADSSSFEMQDTTRFSASVRDE